MSSVSSQKYDETNFLESKFQNQYEKTKSSLFPEEGVLYATNCYVRWGRIANLRDGARLDEWRMGGQGFIVITTLRTLITLIPVSRFDLRATWHIFGRLAQDKNTQIEQWEIYHSVLRPVRVSGQEFFMIISGEDLNIQCYPDETVNPVLDHLRRASIGQLSRAAVIQKDSSQQTLELIEKLKDLKDAGVLSEDEFQKKKIELLAKI